MPERLRGFTTRRYVNPLYLHLLLQGACGLMTGWLTSGLFRKGVLGHRGRASLRTIFLVLRN